VGNQGFKPSQSGLQKLFIMIKAILYACLGVKRIITAMLMGKINSDTYFTERLKNPLSSKLSSFSFEKAGNRACYSFYNINSDSL
jgi:anaerobic C4-dicarboxylate transporter